MFELFFGHKCRNCVKVMEVGFVTTEYGDKDGVFYPGDYIYLVKCVWRQRRKLMTGTRMKR